MITVFGDTVLVGPILEITPLIGPTLLIFCTALIVSYRVLKLVMPSILLATIKSSIFFSTLPSSLTAITHSLTIEHIYIEVFRLSTTT